MWDADKLACATCLHFLAIAVSLSLTGLEVTNYVAMLQFVEADL